MSEILEELEKWLEDEIHGAWTHDQNTREGALLSVARKIKKLKEKKDGEGLSKEQHDWMMKG